MVQFVLSLAFSASWISISHHCNCFIEEARQGMPESLLAEKQINDPAAAHVLARFAAVSEEVLVVTAGVFQGVGEQLRDGTSSVGEAKAVPRTVVQEAAASEYVAADKYSVREMSQRHFEDR